MPKGYFKDGTKTIPPNWKGKKRSLEMRRKLSASRKGMKFSKEHIENLRKSHKGKKPNWEWTEEMRRKQSELRKGENSPFWQGGLSEKNKIIKNSFEYRLWRESVFKRDNYTCVWCGVRAEKGKRVILNADHIKPFSLFPELRVAIDNGRTLCRPCHKKTDSWGVNSFKLKQLYDKKL